MLQAVSLEKISNKIRSTEAILDTATSFYSFSQIFHKYYLSLTDNKIVTLILCQFSERQYLAYKLAFLDGLNFGVKNSKVAGEGRIIHCADLEKYLEQ